MAHENQDEPRLDAAPPRGGLTVRRQAPRASILEYGLIAALIVAGAVAAATLADRPYPPTAPGAAGDGDARSGTSRGG